MAAVDEGKILCPKCYTQVYVDGSEVNEDDSVTLWGACKNGHNIEVTIKEIKGE